MRNHVARIIANDEIFPKTDFIRARAITIRPSKVRGAFKFRMARAHAYTWRQRRVGGREIEEVIVRYQTCQQPAK